MLPAIFVALLLYTFFPVEWKAEAFTRGSPETRKATAWTPGRSKSVLALDCATDGPATAELLGDGDDDEEVVEPGKMRVSEIKAELQLRGISYADCFDKESLIARLEAARASGKADPSILQNFNKQKLEQQFKEEKLELRDEYINAAVANDGTLPGGLTPDQFKKLTSNPEIMALLQSTMMQEAMTLMMTGGREELEKKLKENPELQETVRKLDKVMKTLQ